MGRYGGDTVRYSASRLARPGEAAVEEEIWGDMGEIRGDLPLLGLPGPERPP